jgi:hypothetical protein
MQTYGRNLVQSVRLKGCSGTHLYKILPFEKNNFYCYFYSIMWFSMVIAVFAKRFITATKFLERQAIATHIDLLDKKN